MFENRKQLLEKIEESFQGKTILYVTSDRPNLEAKIAGDSYDIFVEHLDKIGVCKRICLIIYSRGGETLSAWSIINLIRMYCNELFVIIPSRAHSAATLMSLAANKIIMTKQATLGPIDPSVNGPLNPQIPGAPPIIKTPISVEEINGYLELVKDIGIDDSRDKTKIFLELSRQVHPIVLGNVYRSRSQIRMLAKRLISNQINDTDKIEKILNFMCSESGSHDYTINRREAKEELGLRVDKPSDEQYKIIKELFDDFSSELELNNPFNPEIFLADADRKEYSFKRCLIESRERGSDYLVSEGIFIKSQAPIGHPNHPGMLIDNQKLFEGWKYEA